MAHQRQIAGGRETGGTASDDGDPLPGPLRARREGHVTGVVRCVPLQSADVDGGVNHIPAAARLAGMLADQSAGDGERIVLADQTHRVFIAACLNQ